MVFGHRYRGTVGGGPPDWAILAAPLIALAIYFAIRFFSD